MSETNGVFNQLTHSRYGPMLVNKHDRFVGKSLLAYGEFSKGEGDFFRSMIHEGQTVIECGANLGAHTVLFAKLVGDRGKVIALEPQRILHQTLCANVALSCLTNVWAYQAAAGNRQGMIQVAALDPHADNNFGGLELGAQQGVPTEAVPLLQLDVFAEQSRVDFVKIDVEGMETDVLDGARRLLAKHRPILYVEDDRAEKSAGLRALIGELGYECWQHQPPLFDPANFLANPENVWGHEYASHNLICVPTERAGLFARPDATQ